ncbi:hypothetical protein [Maledivibacter halophilus]|uniref:Lipoprotein n=1 Tax=Maledivibacter halophilus TaxID=36842 RepID=A0A1T5IJ05_9FIRM|nr:hypothetical protein [Maledivibacter halophilus]SKC39080.1 hypothetical protein SAMN02194393_00434 [Maledivibacter halophilus]
MNKKKVLILIGVLTILMTSLSVFAYSKQNIYTGLYNHYENSKAKKMQNETKELTTKRVDKLEKVKNRIEDSWKNIEKNISIDKNEYITVTLFNSKDLYRNPEEYLNLSKEHFSYISHVIQLNKRKLPKGSIIPIVYIKKDGTKVIVASKKADGTNIYYKSDIKKNNIKSDKPYESKTENITDPKKQFIEYMNHKGWSNVTTEEESKGTPIKKVD